ncbi:MAG: TRAP transporter small permease [Deltaproteobacteria bacterium]|nr:TRAP transporter small permease [Deltaproteobacteria bacterium]
MNSFQEIIYGLSRRLYWIAGAAIVAMMLITCADVVLRHFRMPIPGTYELVCFLGAVAVAFAMAYTSLEKGHISVSFVVALFPQRIQGLIESITHLFGVFLFGLLAWQSAIYANDLRLSGEVSLTLELPFYPFVCGIAFSAAVVSLILTSDLFKNIRKMIGK